MSAGSPATTPRKAQARSRVTNGKDLLPGIDGRSAVARRYQDLIASLTSDAGGEGQLSKARRQLIRRFAALAVLAESIEARLAMGRDRGPRRALHDLQHPGPPGDEARH
jgi:hypothetical protein